MTDPTKNKLTDPLLQLIGSLSVDIPDLAENHDYYIGQALERKLQGGQNSTTIESTTIEIVASAAKSAYAD
jgi:hypothetical protein